VYVCGVCLIVFVGIGVCAFVRGFVCECDCVESVWVWCLWDCLRVYVRLCAYGMCCLCVCGFFLCIMVCLFGANMYVRVCGVCVS